MLKRVKEPLYNLLRWSEQYTKTDMVYLATSNFWLTGGRFLALGSGMLLTIAFANLLDPATFGTYKYVLAAAGLVSAFSLNTISAGVLRAVAQGKKSAVPGVVRAAMLWSMPASLLAAGVAGYYFWHDNQVLGWGFAFIALFNAVGNGWGLSKAIFLGAGDFKTQMLSGLPRTLFPIAVIILTLFFTENVVLILLAYFASNAVASWVLYRWSLKHFAIKASPEHVGEAVRFGMHMSVLGFFILVGSQLDQLMLWHFTDPATLAVYALALAPVMYANSFLGNFFAIAFPKLAIKSKDEVRRALPLRLWQMFLVSAAGAAAYILLAPFVFTVLFPKYHASIFVSQVLALIILLQPKGIIDTFLTAHGEVRKRYVLIITTQAIDLALIVGLIPFFGLWGAVAATLLTETVSAITLYLLYRRI